MPPQSPQPTNVTPGVPLTSQQIQSMRSQIGIASVSTGAATNGSNDWSWLDKPVTPTPQPNTLDRIGSDLGNAVSKANNTLTENANSRKINTKLGEVSAPSLGSEINTGLQVGGDVAGGIVGSVGELPGLKQIGEGIGDAGKAISDTLMNNPMYADLFSKAAQLEDTHPTATKDIGAIGNIANLALTSEGGSKSAEVVGDSIPNANLSDAVTSAGTGIKKVSGTLADTANSVIAPVRSALTNLPAEVTTALKEGTNPEEIKSQLQTALSEGKKSLTSGGESLDPYELAGRDYLNKAVNILKQNMSDSGDQMSQHMSEFADKPVDVTDTLSKLQDLAKSRLGTVYNGISDAGELAGKTFGESVQKLNDMMESGKNDPTLEGLLGNADGRSSLVTKASDKGLLGKTFAKLQDLHENGTTAQKLSDTIKELKGDLDYQQSSRPKPINTPTEGVVKQVVHDLSSKLDDMGSQTDETGNTVNPYSLAKASYGKAANLMGDLNKRLGGQIGENGDFKNASSMFIRRLSPQDGGTRAVLRELQNQTGVPIFQHAVIAKFAMDVLKDNRVRSVLENIKSAHPSGSGVMKAVWDTISNAVADPEGKAIKILDKRIGSRGTKGIYSAVKDSLTKLDK